MKNIYKYIGIISLMIFSFYYTEKIALFMQSKTQLMKLIESEGIKREVKSIDAFIEKDYIIPGVNGLVINKEKSYNNMKNIESYDDNYLVFDEQTPLISLNNNKDKIVKKGNSIKKAISIIISDSRYISYFKNNKIKVNYLLKSPCFKEDEVEFINDDLNNYYKIEGFLNKYNYNKDLCLINSYNKDMCKENNKYLIEPTYELNDSNLVYYLDEIDSGDILKIDNISLDKIDLLIKAIKYRDLKIVYLSELISENKTIL